MRVASIVVENETEHLLSSWMLRQFDVHEELLSDRANARPETRAHIKIIVEDLLLQPELFKRWRAFLAN